MRINKPELYALATLSSGRYEKEGLLFVLERQEGIFRKSEVNVERWCRLKGNLLFYFKGKDHLSEPLGCIVLDNCDVQTYDTLRYIDLDGYYPFYIIFSGGICHVLASTSDAERSEWLVSLKSAIYEVRRSEFDTLQDKLIARGCLPRENLKWYDNKSKVSEIPSFEVSFSCDSLLCNEYGRPPNPMIIIEVYVSSIKNYIYYDGTEIIKEKCDPVFMSTVVFYSSNQLDKDSLIRITVLDVIEPISNTSLNVGFAFLLLSTVENANNLRVPLKSMNNSNAGFITIHSWKFEKELKSASLTYSSIRSSSSINSQMPQLHRSLSLPTKLKLQSQFPDVSEWTFLSNPFMQTYSFHSELGNNVHVCEYMFETKLCFQLPQELLRIWIGHEQAIIKEAAKIGELKEPWNARKMDLLNRHSYMIQKYYIAKKNLEKEAINGFKQSSRKFDQNLEFAATNLHLQSVWVCDNTSNKSGIYDWVTVGSFTAHCHDMKNMGGLIKLVKQVKESPIKSGVDYQMSVKISMANDAIHAITLLKKDIVDSMRSLIRLATRKETDGMLVICEDMIKKTRSLLNVWDPILAEEAFIFLEEHKLASAPDNSHHMIRRLLFQDLTQNDTTNNSGLIRKKSPDSSETDDEEIDFLGGDSLTSPSDNLKSDELEPWDIIQLNIEASVMCLVSKVKFLCGRCNSPAVRLKQTHNKKVESSQYSNKQLRNRNRFVEGLDLNKISDWTMELRPSMRKLHRAMCGLMKTAHLTLSVLKIQQDSKSAQKYCDVQYRRDVCFSQALTALVTGLMTKLWANKTDTILAEVLQTLGPLAMFECLLSLHGNELDMWGDMSIAVEDLRTVRFTLKSSLDSQLCPKVIGNRNSMTVILPVPYNFHVSTNQYFHVTPVFFNLGINETATIAEKMGTDMMQTRSNIDNFERLNEYYLRYQKLKLGEDSPGGGRYLKKLNGLIHNLKSAIYSDKSKNTDLLHLSTRISRMMKGLQFVSCKSAKDRTGMFVTLDQCQILKDNFYLAESEFQSALDCMRSVGCRRENTRKNINVRKYAFNSVQLMSLPKLYRPPVGTYGSSET